MMKHENPWKFNNKSLRLSIKRPDTEKGPGRYDLDLEKCTTSPEVLDWIMQVAGKEWATDQVVAGLIHELNRILSPQSTLCTGGKEKGPINIKQLLKEKN